MQVLHTLRTAVVKLLLAPQVPPLAKLGMRLGLGNDVKKCYKYLSALSHPDKHDNILEAKQAFQNLGAAYREFFETRNLQKTIDDFRSEPYRFAEEEDVLEAIADHEGTPRMPRKPPPPRPGSSSVPGSASAHEPEAAAEYKIIKEKVNLAFIHEMMGIVGSRAFCPSGGPPLFEQLLWIVKRAKPINVEATVGEITVVLWLHFQDGPLRHRKSSGGFKCKDFPEVAHEVSAGVPDYLLGTSLFMSSRLLKHIARHELGILELDVVNSFFQAIVKDIAPSLNLSPDLMQSILTYVDGRDGIIQLGMDTYKVSRDNIKDLFIRVGFLGSFRQWLKDRNLKYEKSKFSTFVEDLMKAMDALARKIAELTPHLDNLVEGRDKPLATRLCLLYFDTEVRWAEMLEKALPPGVKAVCPEHDGIAIETSMSPEAILKALPVLPFKVAVKLPPQDMLQYLAEQDRHRDGLKLA